MRTTCFIFYQSQPPASFKRWIGEQSDSNFCTELNTHYVEFFLIIVVLKMFNRSVIGVQFSVYYCIVGVSHFAPHGGRKPFGFGRKKRSLFSVTQYIKCYLTSNLLPHQSGINHSETSGTKHICWWDKGGVSLVWRE